MMQSCPHCSDTFEITDDDLAFYKKISPSFGDKTYQIPPPTLCPDCRLRRRMTWRNDRKLYETKDAKTGKKLISMFAPDSDVQVIHKDTWFSDTWDPLEYGQEYDFNRSFFEQFAELIRKVPRANLITTKTENAEYTNYNSGNKGCYLCFAGNYTEDSYYSYNAEMSKDCCDCLFVFRCELCYECTQCEHCYNTHFSLHCNGCKDSFFLEDCSECSDCILCWNLHRKQYCILNEQYSKEEYEQKKSTFALHTQDGLNKARVLWQKERLQYPKRALHSRMAEDSQGEYLNECSRCTQVYNAAKGCQDCKYGFNLFPDFTDAYDCSFSGEKSSLMYECMASGEDCANELFCNICVCGSHDLIYCDCMFHSHHCFGCACLNKKEFCILNKQYSESEYNDLVPKIIEHMRGLGEWGEFFPEKYSLFGYNESHAQEHYPLTKGEVLQYGWSWKNESDEAAKAEKVIPASNLPESIDDIPDDVLNWAILCRETERPYRIVKQELANYRKLHLPLPQLHPDVRHAHRIALRKKHHIYDRTCAKCQKKIQTTYSEERPEKVYCEDCYLAEVY